MVAFEDDSFFVSFNQEESIERGGGAQNVAQQKPMNELIFREVWSTISLLKFILYSQIKTEKCMGYLSIRQTSEKWNVSARWINDLCSEGRIPGAMKIGSYWAIPENAERPRDARIKTGKYIKDAVIRKEI